MVRFKSAVKAGLFYTKWLTGLFIPSFEKSNTENGPILSKHLRYVRKTSKRLAREIFLALVKFGPKLEKKQMLLGRFVDIGCELFAMTATCARVSNICGKLEYGSSDIADAFCKSSTSKIERLFLDVTSNRDEKNYAFAQRVLKSDYEDYLETDIV
jgi:hypothetical protein